MTSSERYWIYSLPHQNMDQDFPQYQTFKERRTAVPDVPRNPYVGEVGPQATSPAHLSMCQHLCKVIQELVDTEKSYVKVSTAVLLLLASRRILLLLPPQFVVLLFFILNLCPKQERVDLWFSLVLQDLVCLLDVYLTPLQKETFLTKDEVKPLKPFGPVRCQSTGGVLTTMSLPQMEVLFGSLPEMLDFHRVFLQTLEDRISSCPNFSSLDTPAQFKVNVSHELHFSAATFVSTLSSLVGRCSSSHWEDLFWTMPITSNTTAASVQTTSKSRKSWSEVMFHRCPGFTRHHSPEKPPQSSGELLFLTVAGVICTAKTDEAFKNFLEARNPTNQHSSSLESYLIKPVQRVLKYPLLLRELVSLTDPESPEHTHLISKAHTHLMAHAIFQL